MLSIKLVLVCLVLIWSVDAQATCHEKSFNVQLNKRIPYINNQLSVVLSVQVTTADNFNLPDDVSLDTYTIDCLANIKIVLKKDNAVLQIVNRPPTPGDKLNSILVTVDNLSPTTKYKVDLSYTQTRPTASQEEITQSNFDIFTCFAAPTKPQDFKAVLDGDGTLQLTWKEPVTLNAPSICYYQIERRLNGGFEKILETTGLSYILSKEIQATTNQVKVIAFNDLKCYGQIIPAEVQCADSRLGTESILVRSDWQTGTITPNHSETTAIPDGSASLARLNLIVLTLSAVFAFIFID